MSQLDYNVSSNKTTTDLKSEQPPAQSAHVEQVLLPHRRLLHLLVLRLLGRPDKIVGCGRQQTRQRYLDVSICDSLFPAPIMPRKVPKPRLQERFVTLWLFFARPSMEGGRFGGA